MPRLSKALPRYSKHRASGQAVVTLNGRDYYLGPYGTKASKLEYDRLIGEWLAGGRCLVNESTPQDITVDEICVDYAKHAKAFYRKNGKSTSEWATVQIVLKEFRRLYGKTLAIDFGPLKFKAFRQTYIDRGLARITINHYLLHVIKAFRHAAGNEKLSAEIYRNLESVERLQAGRSKAKESKPIKPVSLETIETTVPHLLPIVADMLRIQLLTGMRPSEACNIRPVDIDRSSDVWVFIPEEHKTEHHEKKRVIYIGPEAQAVLAPYLLRNEQDYCFSPSEAVEQQRRAKQLNRKTPLSCGNRPGTNRKAKPKRTTGEKYNSDSYRRAIHRACDKAEIGRWSPNRLRKTAATNIRRICDLEAAQVILGHASKSTTEKFYAEVANEKAVEVMRKMG